MITALSEFVDFLYTRASIEDWGCDVCWSISVRMIDLELPQAGPQIQMHAHRQLKDGEPIMWKEADGGLSASPFHTVTCNFDSVERGHRVGPEELGVVANYYIKKLKQKLGEA